MKLNKYCTLNIHVKSKSQYASPLWAAYAQRANGKGKPEYLGTFTMEQFVKDAEEYAWNGNTHHVTIDIYPRKSSARRDRYKLLFSKYKIHVWTERGNDYVACINISTGRFDYFNSKYAQSKHYIHSLVFYKSKIDGSEHLTRRALDTLTYLER